MSPVSYTMIAKKCIEVLLNEMVWEFNEVTNTVMVGVTNSNRLSIRYKRVSK